MRRGRKRVSLEGLRVGHLTVIAFAEMHDNRNYWLCECDCGNSTIVRSDHLTGKQLTLTCWHNDCPYYYAVWYKTPPPTENDDGSFTQG